MELSKREKALCKKYSKYDESIKSNRCDDCPLAIPESILCKGVLEEKDWWSLVKYSNGYQSSLLTRIINRLEVLLWKVKQ